MIYKTRFGLLHLNLNYNSIYKNDIYLIMDYITNHLKVINGNLNTNNEKDISDEIYITI